MAYNNCYHERDVVKSFYSHKLQISMNVMALTHVVRDATTRLEVLHVVVTMVLDFRAMVSLASVSQKYASLPLPCLMPYSFRHQ